MATTFNCAWINRQNHFGFVDMDALITNDSGIIPEFRVSKNWQMSESACDVAFLEAQAIDLVDKVIEDWNILNPEV